MHEGQIDVGKQRSAIDVISKITTKILDIFKRKEKIAAIFFNIKKACDSVNIEKALEQLKNMGIQRRVVEYIKEGERRRIHINPACKNK